MDGFDATSSDRPAPMCAHLRIELSLDHLIQCLPARNQDGRERVQSTMKAREWLSTTDEKRPPLPGQSKVYFRLR
jgi:hypothetical protein